MADDSDSISEAGNEQLPGARTVVVFDVSEGRVDRSDHLVERIGVPGSSEASAVSIEARDGHNAVGRARLPVRGAQAGSDAGTIGACARYRQQVEHGERGYGD